MMVPILNKDKLWLPPKPKKPIVNSVLFGKSQRNTGQEGNKLDLGLIHAKNEEQKFRHAWILLDHSIT